VLLLAGLMVAFAYVSFGLTGFGSTVLALPLLAHLLTLKVAVPMLVLLDFTAFLVYGRGALRKVRYDEILPLVPWILAGMAIGLTLLIEVPEDILFVVLGLFLLVYALHGLARRGPPSVSRRWIAPIGLSGGAFSALYGTGGVLFALYNAGRITDKAELRATNAAMIMYSALLRIVLFAATGLLLDAGLIFTALLLAPPMLAGFWLGTRLNARLPAAAVVKAVYALLVIAGLTLLARSL
jgi:uncharacterized membrane protein YfcA